MLSGLVNESVKRNFAPEVDQPTQDVDEKTEDVEDASNGQRIETEEEGEKEDAGVAVIRDALLETANAMLSEFLRKTRQSRRKGGGSRGIDSRKIDIVRLTSPPSDAIACPSSGSLACYMFACHC